MNKTNLLYSHLLSNTCFIVVAFFTIVRELYIWKPMSLLQCKTSHLISFSNNQKKSPFEDSVEQELFPSQLPLFLWQSRRVCHAICQDPSSQQKKKVRHSFFITRVTPDNIISADMLHKIINKTQQKWERCWINPQNVYLYHTRTFV